MPAKAGRSLGGPLLTVGLEVFRGQLPGQRQGGCRVYSLPLFNSMSHVTADCQLYRAFYDAVILLWLTLRSPAHAEYVSAAQVCSGRVGDTHSGLCLMQGMML